MLGLAFLIFLCNVLRRTDDLLVLGFFEGRQRWEGLDFFLLYFYPEKYWGCPGIINWCDPVASCCFWGTKQLCLVKKKKIILVDIFPLVVDFSSGVELAQYFNSVFFLSGVWRNERGQTEHRCHCTLFRHWLVTCEEAVNSSTLNGQRI